MYQREPPAPRRRRRRKKSPMPLLFVAVAAFVIAFRLLPESRAEPPLSPTALPVVALDAVGEPVPDPRGREPDLPGSAEEDWLLRLVNPWNPLPEDFSVTLKDAGGGHKVDERCWDDLQAMLGACRDAGLSPLICSSYRSQEKQEELYRNKVRRLTAMGMSQADAEAEAGTVVAVPGTSEHQLGLAVDIVDVQNQNLDTSQEGTEVQKWLMAHSWEYGFILRYPTGKSDVTGIIYEPWHYRYVGKDAAKEIYESGLCLEEYLGIA